MIEPREIGWNLMKSYLRLPTLFYQKIQPTPVQEPKIVLLNQSLAKEMGFRIDFLKEDRAKELLSGNIPVKNSVSFAQAYAGHQFGQFTMLGDGRAIMLGEHKTPEGKVVDVQLKGAGPTPYSRGGDGRGALGPMLREYIISEAMHALGIPTTRSLAVTETGEPVLREQRLKGAILTRIASSHIRVGTFQYAAVFGTTEDLKALANYTIKRHFPAVMENENPYLKFLERVIEQQAKLISQWQLVGFIHGVMNTDNMTISGETIDYGPCAFMDVYRKNTVFSSIDQEGRYAYVNQPFIGKWNLARFAEALLPLLDAEEKIALHLAEKALQQYDQIFHFNFLQGMRRKLGLFNEEIEDEELIKDLLTLMEKYDMDYTNTFVHLTFDRLKDKDFQQKSLFKEWYQKWKQRLSRQKLSWQESKELMQQHNPAIIPRNYFVEEALQKAVDDNDFEPLNNFMKALSNPYAHTAVQTAYAKVPKTNVPYQTYCGT